MNPEKIAATIMFSLIVAVLLLLTLAVIPLLSF